MNVLIEDIDNPDYAYVAQTRQQCKDEVDKSVYDEVIFNDGLTICMGHIVGSEHPIATSTSEEWLDLYTDASGDCYSDADPGL